MSLKTKFAFAIAILVLLAFFFLLGKISWLLLKLAVFVAIAWFALSWGKGKLSNKK